MEQPKPRITEQYSALANIYDEVMKDVSYAAWTEYIDRIIHEHHPDPADLLELACGTGTMAVEMSHLDDYNIVATDRSPQMIGMAQKKAKKYGSGVEFEVMDFLDFQLGRTFDVIYMVFDSINYVHSESEIQTLQRNAFDHLNPGGLFIFDFTTPRNSHKAIQYLDKMSGESGPWRYRRSSRYEPDECIHINEFTIIKTGSEPDETDQRYVEKHRQKIYTLDEMLTMVAPSPFSLIAAYDGFTLNPAGQKSLRITMVLQRSESDSDVA